MKEPIIIRQDLHKLIRQMTELKQPTSHVVLLPHNKAKNRYQRIMDEAICNLTADVDEHPVALQAHLHRTLTDKLSEIHAMNPRHYMPTRVKVSFDNGTPELIIGDKSHPYFRVIRIEYVAPKQ